MDEITVLETFFKSRQVLLARPWLKSCINWCKQENLPDDYTIKDLQFNVFEQWLLLDLRDVEIPCLPPNLSGMTKHTLTGDYSLQVMQIVDISKPKHWQLQRIRNGVPKNLEQDMDSSKRALMLTLTDGVQEIGAFENGPIKCLNLNMSPGIKVRLMGPVDVRRGRILLQENNIKILGGEVESLIVPNAAENVLARHLKLPLNPEPKVIQESILTADTSVLDQSGDPPSHQHRAIKEISNQLLSSSNNVGGGAPSNCVRGTMPLGVPEKKEIDYLDEDSRINEEIELMMEVEMEMERSDKKIKLDEDVLDNMLMDDSNLENLEIPAMIEDLPKPQAIVPTDAITKSPVNEHEHSDFFADIDLDAHLDKIDKDSTPSASSSQMKLWTIEKLIKNLPNISNGKFKIKAKFVSVVEKMSVVDDEFHLVIKVTDDADDIDVRLHTNVVAEFFGCTAAAVMQLKSEVKQRSAPAQRKMLEGLKSLKDELTNIDRIAEVQVNASERFPVVLRFL